MLGTYSWLIGWGLFSLEDGRGGVNGRGWGSLWLRRFLLFLLLSWFSSWRRKLWGLGKKGREEEEEEEGEGRKRGGEKEQSFDNLLTCHKTNKQPVKCNSIIVK